MTAKKLEFEFREICCPVCGNDDFVFRGWRGGEAHHSGAGVKTAICRCKNCTHQFPNPMPFPKENLDEVYVDADEYFHGQKTEEKKQLSLNLMTEFEKRVGKKGKFLDVGCGTGELIWAAKEKGWDFEGVDPSKEFIEIARKNLGIKGRVSTLEDAAFPENYFDAVALGSIIEHLYTPLETLKEVFRILKPGGWLWLDAPNEDGLYMQFGDLYMKMRRKPWVIVMAPTFPPFHVQGFNPHSMKLILENANLKLQSIETVGEVISQTGSLTLRKKIENSFAKTINSVGKKINRGLYMSVWAQKV